MVNKGQLSIGLRLEAWVWVTDVSGEWIPVEVIWVPASDDFAIVRTKYPDDCKNYSLRRHISNLRMIGESQCSSRN